MPHRKRTHQTREMITLEALWDSFQRDVLQPAGYREPEVIAMIRTVFYAGAKCGLLVAQTEPGSLPGMEAEVDAFHAEIHRRLERLRQQDPRPNGQENPVQ